MYFYSHRVKRFNRKKITFSFLIAIVVGTQKNRLNETVFFEHLQDLLNIMSKKIFTILR